MPYHVPIDEMIFCAEHVIGQNRLSRTPLFADATSEMRGDILAEIARLAEGALVPVNRDGDLHPARLEDGVVHCSPGFDRAYRAIAEGGWIGISAEREYGGMALPISFACHLNEAMSAACLSLSLNPMLTQGQIGTLERYASEAIKELYLPKLISGEWTGTMNLTEPQAGSDVGALTTRAEPAGDGGYHITGQKIFISWGDHDLGSNICHLVLARLPDSPPGTKGISLFLVPKLIPDADGAPGRRNDIRTLGLEDKLGLHGSPTVTLAYEGALGWLIGPPHGGMQAMFTMMNDARLAVGVEGVGIAEAATQKARRFVLERRQGITADGSPTIIGHADVRRMLMRMQVLTRIARAICYDCAFSLDMARADDADRRWAARAAFLTPIAKVVGTETGIEVADLGIQLHGGTGYIEGTGAAQLLRDVRVTAIYEGTNGIQAMDLAARKLADGGAAALGLLREIEETGARLDAAGKPAAGISPALHSAAEHLRTATEWMLAASDINDRLAGAMPYLHLWGLVLGAHYMGRAVLASPDQTRFGLARFHARQILPHSAALMMAATDGAAPLYSISADKLGL